MRKYPESVYCTTTAMQDYTPPIPESAALRKMIEKFAEYRAQIAEEADKKEFDAFLDSLRKSTSDS